MKNNNTKDEVIEIKKKDLEALINTIEVQNKTINRLIERYILKESHPDTFTFR